MGEALNRKEYLTLLAKARNRQRREKLIDLANKHEIIAVAEIVLNLLKGQIPLTDKQNSSIKRYKNVLREITRRSTSLKKKKRLLKQKGGFLPTLIPIALTILSNLIK